MGCQWRWIQILESVSVFAIYLTLIGRCNILPFLPAPVVTLKYCALKGILLVSESLEISLHHPQGTIGRAGGWTYIVLDHRHLVRSPACALWKGPGTEIRGTALPWAVSGVADKPAPKTALNSVTGLSLEGYGGMALFYYFICSWTSPFCAIFFIFLNFILCHMAPVCSSLPVCLLIWMAEWF